MLTPARTKRQNRHVLKSLRVSNGFSFTSRWSFQATKAVAILTAQFCTGGIQGSLLADVVILTPSDEKLTSAYPSCTFNSLRFRSQSSGSVQKSWSH
jgi:hypothetical protein